VPTSSNEAIRPIARIHPVVGDVILETNLSRVDLPTPFLPIIPKIYSCSIPRLISFSVHRLSFVLFEVFLACCPIFKYRSSFPKIFSPLIRIVTNNSSTDLTKTVEFR